MVKIGDRVRIRAGARVGQDMSYGVWRPFAAIEFVVVAIDDKNRCKLHAPAHGDPDDYGNGAVYAYVKDLDPAERAANSESDRLATLEAENAKLRDLLRRVRGCFGNGMTPAAIGVEVSKLVAEIKSAIEPGNPGEVKP